MCLKSMRSPIDRTHKYRQTFDKATREVSANLVDYHILFLKHAVLGAYSHLLNIFMPIMPLPQVSRQKVLVTYDM
jgi:hypothetical protein